MTSQIITVTDDNFDSEVLKSDIPVLVDFWAEWCGPCKMIAPVLDILAEQYQGKVKICKVNVDDNKKTPSQYSIRSIPTLIIFKNGELKDTKMGALSKAQISEFLESYL
jgi:thioredoxin 1